MGRTVTTAKRPMSKCTTSVAPPQVPVALGADVEALARLLAGLASYRRESGISRAEVARKMRTTRAVVARLEAHRGPAEALQVRTVLRYARAIGVPIGWLAALPTGEELYRPVEDSVCEPAAQSGVALLQQRQASSTGHIG